MKVVDEFLKTKGVNALLCVLIFSMTLSIGVSSIVLAILYFLSLSFIFKQRHQLHIKTIDIVFLAFFFSQAVSFFWTENISEYFNEIEKLLVFFFIPLLFIGIRSMKIDLNYYLISLCCLISLSVFGLILMSFSLYDIFINNKPIIEFVSKNVRFNLVELSPINFHPPYFGMFLCFGIVLCIHNSNKARFRKELNYGFILFFLLLLYLNSSMSSYLNLAILLVVYSIFKFKKSTLLIILAIILALTALILSFYLNDIKNFLHYDPADGYWETPRYRILRVLHEGDPTRKKTWLSTIKIFKENIYFGVGIGDLIDNLQSLREVNTYAYINRLNTHNQYLSIMGGTGIMGFVTFIAILANNLILSIKQRSFLFFSFSTIIMIAFFTENILSRQWGLIFFCVFNYLIYEYNRTFKIKA